MDFRIGDKVRVEGTISAINSAYDWVSIEVGGGVIGTLQADHVELIERVKTAGQRAYEAFWEKAVHDHMDWPDLTESVREKWDRVAEAVTDGPE